MNPASKAAIALARIRVVLVRTTHPGNIGAAARAMWTMGLRQLVLVMPERFPDPEATALATGAAEVLAARADRHYAARRACRLRARRGAVGASACVCRPRAAHSGSGREIVERATDGDVALVFGTEMSGLSNAELAQCGTAATIPANPEYPSLNLAAAVQVAAYELRIAAGEHRVWAAPQFRSATHDEIEALHAHARRTLTALRFLNPAQPKRLLPRLRRLFGRAQLEREEVNILRGILARVDQFVDRDRER